MRAPCVCVCVHACVRACARALVLSHVRRFGTPWTATRQAPLSVRFPRQDYWSGLPFPPLGYLPNPGIEPISPSSPALANGFIITGSTWEASLF